jgi:hypothetical protein
VIRRRFPLRFRLLHWAPGEFTRARLRLTGWYAGLLIVVLTAVGVLAYVLMTARLDDQVDSALADEVLSVSPALGQLVDSAGGTPLPVVEPTSSAAAGSMEAQGSNETADGASDEGALHELAEQGQVPPIRSCSIWTGPCWKAR